MDCWNELRELLRDWAEDTKTITAGRPVKICLGFSILPGSGKIHNVTGETQVGSIAGETVKALIVKFPKVPCPAVPPAVPLSSTMPGALPSATLNIFKALRTELSRPEHARAALESKLDAYLAQWYFATRGPSGRSLPDTHVHGEYHIKTGREALFNTSPGMTHETPIERLVPADLTAIVIEFPIVVAKLTANLKKDRE